MCHPWIMSIFDFDCSKIDKSKSGHPLGTLSDPQRILLTPRKKSISNFDHTIEFVSQSTYKWIIHTSLYLKIRSGHLSGTFPNPWRIFLIPRMVFISDFDHSIEFSHKVHQNWYITLLCSTKILKKLFWSSFRNPSWSMEYVPDTKDDFHKSFWPNHWICLTK